jgi:hypothetical protein
MIEGQIETNASINGNINQTEGISGNINTSTTIEGNIENSQTIEGQTSSSEKISGSVNEAQGINGNVNIPVIRVGSPMTEIEVSTNPEAPTDITQYFEKSGTYVAKNTGIIEFEGTPTPLTKGGYFTVQNFKDDASQFGVEVPDEYNVIMVSLFVYNGEIFEEVILKKIGNDNWSAAVKLTSENASDYLDLDIDVTSEVQQVLMSVVSSSYGMQLIGNRYLTFVSASNSEIDSANTSYRVITPSNGKYLVQKWGNEFYATKEQYAQLSTNLTTLETNVNTLKSEIETILDSVVIVDE